MGTNTNPLLRTTYSDPTTGGTPRTGDVSRGAEALIDAESYGFPLERLHASGLHEGGVASGLTVTAALGSAGVSIETGVAVDFVGRHISLAEGGKAETDPSAGNPQAPGSALVDVSATGMGMPTNAPFNTVTGTKYLTIQWWETFDYGEQMQGLYRMLHTPWIRFQDVAAIDPLQHVVLAKVTCDASGNVTAIDPGVRRGTGLPVEQVHFKSAQQPNSHTVQDGAWAEIHARKGGGLSIELAGATDLLEIQRVPSSNDTKRNFAQVTVGAGRVVARKQTSGAETLALDVEKAVLRVGTTGVNGEIHLHDSADMDAISLTTADATVLAGGKGKTPGMIVAAKFSDKTSIAMAKLDGANGHVWFNNELKDLFHPGKPGVNHNQLRELTYGDFTKLHKHDVGVLGRWGDTGARVGVVTAGFGFPAPTDVVEGNMTLDFTTATWTGAPVAPQSQWARGFKGSFAGEPNVLQSIYQVWITSDEDVMFYAWLDSVSTTQMTIHYYFDMPMVTGWQRIAVLAIGPIA